MSEIVSYQAVLQQVNTGADLAVFGDYVRELLVDTTLNSIAENQVPELVERAIVTGLWSPDYAIKLANRITDGPRKVRMCAALLSIESLNEQQRHHLESAAFETVNTIEYKDSRFNTLFELIQLRSLRPQLQDVACCT